jgi:hypothetical protein
MVQQTTALQVNQDTRIVSYTDAIDNVGESITSKAQYNVRQQLAELARSGDGREFGQLQIEAMEQVEALRLVGGLDLYSILLRYKFIRNILDHNLLAVHPGNYTVNGDGGVNPKPMKTMAEEQGISISELHDIIKLGSIVFPFLTQEYGPNAVADWWEDLGKARMREMVPTLISAITGERSGSGNVRTAIATATEAAALNYVAEDTGSTLTWNEIEPAERRRRVAREVADIVRRSPNVREMRHALRGTTGTGDIMFLSNETDDGRFIVCAELTSDQRLMMQRLMTDRVEFQAVNQNDMGWEALAPTFTGIDAMLDRARTRLQAPQEDEVD